MQNTSNKIIALLGPTNTGKTHVAIDKMLEFKSGIFGFPLRLLAREVYDKCVKKIGSDALAPSQLEQRTEYKFPATIELEEQTFKIQDGSSLPLQVGMSLSANIKLRKVSYLQLLFSNFEKKTDALKSF